MGKKITDEQKRVFFDCSKCPAYCCGLYERIQVSKRDLNRLAKHFGVTPERAAKRYTKMWDGRERVLKRTPDPILGEACQFLDHETRGCSIYHARPEVCRTYPDRPRCVYYDVLKFERQQQADETVLPLFQITFREVEKKVVTDEHGSEKIWEWKQKKK